MSKIAVVQHAPAVLDREKTVSRVCALLTEAAAAGASLVVFPETFVPCYPAWIWRLRPGSDSALSAALHARLLDNAVNLRRGDLVPVCAVARQSAVTVVCGIIERDEDASRGTIYNTAVTIGPDGSLLNKHRKLMPTHAERMVWGFGDGSSLKVVDTPAGRLGTLICWESYMPLARFALYAQGIEIYVAPTYDSGDDWVATLQHIAREGGCWVLGSGNLLRASDLGDDFPEKATLYPHEDEWINDGDSVVIAPGGKIVAGPLRQKSGILYADIALEAVSAARRRLDVAGHYARPDVLRLHVSRVVQAPMQFD